MTSVECVGAADVALPPQLILAGKQYLEKWIVKELHPDSLLAVSDTGYSNNDLTMD